MNSDNNALKNLILQMNMYIKVKISNNNTNLF